MQLMYAPYVRITHRATDALVLEVFSAEEIHNIIDDQIDSDLL